MCLIWPDRCSVASKGFNLIGIIFSRQIKCLTDESKDLNSIHCSPSPFGFLSEQFRNKKIRKLIFLMSSLGLRVC